MITNSTSDLNTIAQALYDKKGCNILALDLRNMTSLTDYVLIAEGPDNYYQTSRIMVVK